MLKMGLILTDEKVWTLLLICIRPSNGVLSTLLWGNSGSYQGKKCVATQRNTSQNEESYQINGWWLLNTNVAILLFIVTLENSALMYPTFSVPLKPVGLNKLYMCSDIGWNTHSQSQTSTTTGFELGCMDKSAKPILTTTVDGGGEVRGGRKRKSCSMSFSIQLINLRCARTTYQSWILFCRLICWSLRKSPKM